MKRAEMIEAIRIELEDIRAENYFDEKGSEWCSNLLLTRIEELGMAPPCLPSEQCQDLMRKYIEPNFNKWEL